MLVLTRKTDETIKIGEDIEITVLHSRQLSSTGYPSPKRSSRDARRTTTQTKLEG